MAITSLPRIRVALPTNKNHQAVGISSTSAKKRRLEGCSTMRTRRMAKRRMLRVVRASMKTRTPIKKMMRRRS